MSYMLKHWHCTDTVQNMKFSIKDFYSKCDQEIADLVTFTKEILNGKLLFFLQSDKKWDKNLSKTPLQNFDLLNMRSVTCIFAIYCVCVQVWYIASKAELDIYHNNLCIRVTSRATERLQIEELEKKISKLGGDTG